MAGLLVLSAFGNSTSSSDWERFVQAPVALLLPLLRVVVALGEDAPRTLG